MLIIVDFSLFQQLFSLFLFFLLVAFHPKLFSFLLTVEETETICVICLNLGFSDSSAVFFVMSVALVVVGCVSIYLSLLIQFFFS